ncbi:DUF1697 domain-containing protein [Rhodobacterales bacterium HKCCE4037]|nr:DUF1697 domain-containing protein [Rhodobacterales bacterium HKCCE4037]
MSAQVLLLRGINVGGHGKLPMAELRTLLDELGAGGARTYIQSGNAVCPVTIDTDALADRIEQAYGFRREIHAFTGATWRRVVATNPFPVDVPKAVHGFFHAGDPIDTDAMLPFLAENERLASQYRVLWLHAPDGIGRSKFAEKSDRLAARPITARNWNTIVAITKMLDAI